MVRVKEAQHFLPAKLHIKTRTKIRSPHHSIFETKQTDTILSVPLFPKRASFCKPRSSPSRLAQHRLAITTDHNCLRVAENRGSAD